MSIESALGLGGKVEEWKRTETDPTVENLSSAFHFESDNFVIPSFEMTAK